MASKFRSYLLILAMSLLPSCFSKHKKEAKQKPLTVTNINHEKKEESPWITVWIHGTQPSFETSATKGLRANLKKLSYKYFYCPKGIHALNTQPETNRHCKLARLLQEKDSFRFQTQHFYTFGWSGHLSFQEREKAGTGLYIQLLDLIETYEKQCGKKPYVRLITHSHGGNVALNLAAAEHQHQKSLIVDELILLACPVQEKTVAYVQTPIFKKIYSFYSSLDVLQVVDPQGLYRNNAIQAPIFSKRRFPECDHLIQTKIRFAKRAILHVEFLSNQFLQALPSILTTLDTCQTTDSNKKQSCIIIDNKSFKTAQS